MKFDRIIRSGYCAAWAACVLVVGVALAGAAGEEPKAAVPSREAQDPAGKLVRDIFKAQYADNTTTGRRKLAAELIAQADKSSDDPAARYVLLREARDAGAQGLDVGVAFDAIDRLDQYYVIDAAGQKAQILAAVVPRLTPADAAKAAGHALDLIEKLVAADDYAAAASLVSPAQTAVGKAKDDAIKARLNDNRAALAEYERVRLALDKLKADPKDPSANLAAGKFYCFTRGDFARGGPMLALGSDARLKPLGVMEQGNPTDAGKQKDAADAWYDYAQTQPAKIKAACLIRAAEWYAKAGPNLTGLAKAAAEKRIEQIGKLASLSAPPRQGAFKVGEWVDLLKLVDPIKDVVKGDWKLEGTTASTTTEAFQQKLVLPVLPDGDYDLQLTFARMAGTDDIGIVFPVGTGRVNLVLGGWGDNGLGGLYQIDGKGVGDNAATVRDNRLLNGTPYTADVHVRLKEAEADVKVELNGKPFLQWRGRQASLTTHPAHAMPGPAVAGLYVARSRTTFASAKLRMVSGKLTLLRTPAAATPAGWAGAVDVLKAVDPLKQAVAGEWRREGDAIVTGADGPPDTHVLRLSAATDGEYDLRATFARTAGDSDVCITFPVGAGRTSLVLDCRHGQFGGLELIDEARADVNPTRVPNPKLTNGRSYTVEIAVRLKHADAEIGVTLDGQQIVRWTGPQSVLHTRPALRSPGVGTFNLGTYQSAVKFTGVRIKMVSGQLREVRDPAQ